ncbi:MAG: pullulanase-type alpha-1,6-glucosidase, partial [Chloroflexota bacterium]
MPRIPKLRILGLLVLLVSVVIAVWSVNAQDEGTEQPDMVTVAGSFQSLLGCPEDMGDAGNWAPDCDVTALTQDPVSGLWRGTFELNPGTYEYKVAINGSWEQNYGANAEPDGANITLNVSRPMSVQFVYDHATNWIADSVTHVIANVPGSFQSELGCPDSMGDSGDWAPECLITWLQDPDGDGVYTYLTDQIPVGDYEAKVAVDGSWSLNYGADGTPDGANIPFSVTSAGAPVAFLFNTADNVLTINTDGSTDVSAMATASEGVVIDAPARPVNVEQPDMVVISGSIQSVLGCEGDWDPACEITALTYSPEEDIWRGSFDLPAGSYEYKVAINGTWDENYGGSADADGPNVALILEEDTTVDLYYDHFTNWVADSVNDMIATAPGSYQAELGCPEALGAEGDWAPSCLRAWLQDPDADGVYVFATEAIPAGDYEVKVAIDESWDEDYGADGAPGGANIPFTVPEDGTKVVFAFNSSDNNLTIGVGEPAVIGRVVTVNLGRSQAYWVTADTIAWEIETGDDIRYELVYSLDAGLEAEGGDIVGGESIPLVLNPDGLSEDVLRKFPHLAGLEALTISEDDLSMVPEILRGQVAVAAYDGDGQLIGGTSLQIPGVLDDLYTNDSTLGVTYVDGAPIVSVWAPTAQNVRFHLFADSEPATEATVFDMVRDDATGVWTIEGEPDWTYQYYLFEVTVYAPTVQRVVTNMVTDPYSYSLSMNSTRSQIVDIFNDTTLMPEGWMDLEKPLLNAPEDVAIYELHVRDFSAIDPAVPEELVGTFAAFTVEDSNGTRHLAELADAGMTHIHLLPSFDIATINEDASERVEPDFEELASYPPDSEQQTEIITPIRDQDAFNWGYDPLHYTVPEGSYSTDPDVVQRIIEFRQMVQALNNNGLRVVIDVVYNHTNAAGQSGNSVLDRIVPGYYHRLDANGNVTTSTCCPNTATEHNMMRKLMIDSVETWATVYRVDGLRFDLMGHHMLEDMIAVRETLDALTLEADGVDGEAIYVYGEGWNFGEVADNARGVNATQLNIPGTGIGVFNDRLRDAARGGSPFSGQQHQGFMTGLYTDDNGLTPGSEEEQFARLLLFSDQIRVGLAGNLRDYMFVGASGEVISGSDVDYNGSPAGYTLDPQENIVYVAAHDNETLWDAVQYKAPADLDVAGRVRMNNLGVSIVALSQGIPFFHAGDDMLRSKSLDRDSYNSGDCFNRLDFTYQINNWGF